MSKFTDKQIADALNSNNTASMKILGSKQESDDLIGKVEKNLNKLNKNSPIAKLTDDIVVLVDVVKSYVKGEYKEIPLKSIVAIVSALVYFVSPIDLIPDVIPGVGHVDDAAVIGLAIKLVRSDLDDYREWKKNK